MAVSVLDRPYGRILNTSAGEFTASGANGTALGRGQIQFNRISHGLSTSHYIYIFEGAREYLGFWYVERIDANNFEIRKYAAASDQLWFGDSTISYYLCSDDFSGDAKQTWSCVHLPIVYRLSNDLWPTNSVDTARDITSVTDSNGYCNITAAGDIKASGSAQVLDFVKVTGCSNDDLNGVWQIVTYSSDTSFVLNIPYSSGADTDLTNNGTVQYYYNNYVVKVDVWAGLNAGHEFYGIEPYESIGILNLVPDENNECVFSIAEILKKNIEFTNNLTGGTLPNNIDAFTMFFIKYGEEYDDSTQIYVGRTAVTYTSDIDNFEGRAMNAILPFKNVYSGALSDYYFKAETQAKFLTDFSQPTLFSGKYFDLGFLWDGVKDIFFKLEWYLRDALVLTEIGDNIDSFYTGVYRGLVEYSGSCTDYDRVDVTAYQTTGLAPPPVWVNVTNSFDTKTSTQFTEAVTSATSEVSARTPFVLASGDKVRIRYTVVISGTWTPASGTVGPATTFDFHDSGGNSVATKTSTTVNGVATSGANAVFVANGTYLVEEFFTLTSTSVYIFFDLLEISGVTSGTADFVITPPTIIEAITSSAVISETKTIHLNCNCTLAQAQSGIYLSWINNLGHFDYWFFQGYKDNVIDIEDSGETEVNIFPEWPDSYGEFADTSNRKQTFIKASEQWVLRTSNLSTAQVEALKKIKTSPLVQIVNSIYDRRTVIVDKNSFTAYEEKNKLHELSFTITYTDDVPSQRV